jgi:hypothetical protein
MRELMHIKQSASDKYGKLLLMLFTNSDLVMAFPSTNGLLLLIEAHSPASETPSASRKAVAFFGWGFVKNNTSR